MMENKLVHSDSPVYPTRRDPILVCPHCKRPVLEMLATNDGKLYDIYRCRDHGDVVAILSEVENVY